MASSIAKFTFFLLFLVSFSSIEARESKFFSKFMHYGTKESVSDTFGGELAPAPAPIFVESGENGYGLYGHETGLFAPSKDTSTPSTTTTTTSAFTTVTGKDESELLNQELDSYSYEKGDQGNNYDNNNGDDTNNYNYNNNAFNNNDKNNYRLTGSSYVTGNQNNNGYTTTTYNNNNDYYTNNDNNRYQTNNYNNNGYETEKQGMSDTRFVEGGKYYYDVNNPTNGYESETTNTKYPNEYNSMEEYENQEVYQQGQNESELP